LNASTPKVFLSYRREETSVHTGWLHDEMEARFGHGNVFIDVDLELSVNFVRRLSELLADCQVMLVVIGPRWATIESKQGRPRLFEDRDFVRYEVEKALERPDVKVIPVLVAGAHMPDPKQLPESLRELPDLNGIRISDDLLHRRDDVKRLMTTVEGHIPKPQTETPSFVRPFLEGLLVAAAAGLAGSLLGGAINTSRDDDVTWILSNATQRAVTWAVVGAAIAVWLTILRGESRGAVGRGLFGLILGALAGALGGAIFGAATLPQDVTEDAKDQIQIGALAAIGCVIGALLGRLWIPPRAGPGLLAGAAGGALAEIILNAGDWWDRGDAPAVGFRCVVIVAFVLATMFALDALRTTAPASTGVRPATWP
jgi:uncharacterized membrane protein YeaQ/YmgE (transglycosylase-associated protein family)